MVAGRAQAGDDQLDAGFELGVGVATADGEADLEQIVGDVAGHLGHATDPLRVGLGGGADSAALTAGGHLHGGVPVGIAGHGVEGPGPPAPARGHGS